MNQRRRTAGTPSGGQFAEDAKAEAAGTDALAATPTGAETYEPLWSEQYTKPAGYHYGGEIFTPDGVVDQLIREERAAPDARDMDIDEVLHQIADADGIDTSDEWSFDTSEFPKPVFIDKLDHGAYVQGVDGPIQVDLGDTARLAREAAQTVDLDAMSNRARTALVADGAGAAFYNALTADEEDAIPTCPYHEDSPLQDEWNEEFAFELEDMAGDWAYEHGEEGQ